MTSSRREMRVRLARRSYVDEVSGCVLFTGPLDKQGYGRIWDAIVAEKKLVHRVAYELFVGPIPDGHEVDHVRSRGCVHRHCVNPAHLEAVTPRENTMRSESPSALNARRTSCIHGHAFTSANTRVDRRGRRHCRRCDANRQHAYRLRKAAAA